MPVRDLNIVPYLHQKQTEIYHIFDETLCIVDFYVIIGEKTKKFEKYYCL